uniref:Wall-associated receptor kinase galacturonan-binding domain-containing protein n=1 Tax=Fagus sylvatica TaxID=28930 RepID=A0A2N9FY57_FAGSY
MAAAAIPFPLALPDCPDRCGDVEIPYPFGLTEGCYLKETGDFYINCSDLAGKAQPKTGNVVVKEISIQGQIDILMYKAFDCYNNSATGLKNNSYATPSLRVPSSQFLTPKTSSWPLAVTLMHTLGVTKMMNRSPLVACPFAFTIRQDQFNFSSSYLSSLQNNKTLPMVLDWAIGTETCEDARKNKSAYRCGGNSTCHNSINGSGYRCNCTTVTREPIPQRWLPRAITARPNKFVLINPEVIIVRAIKGYHLDGEACVTDQQAVPPSGQSSLAISLAVGEYLFFY